MGKSCQKANRGKGLERKNVDKKVLKGKVMKGKAAKGIGKRGKPGMMVLKEIKKYQKSTDLLVSQLHFQRVVWEIAQNHRADLQF